MSIDSQLREAFEEGTWHTLRFDGLSPAEVCADNPEEACRLALVDFPPGIYRGSMISDGRKQRIMYDFTRVYVAEEL